MRSPPGRAERDPTGDLKGVLPPVKGTHFAAVTDPKKVGGVLRAIDVYQGTLIVRCAPMSDNAILSAMRRMGVEKD